MALVQITDDAFPGAKSIDFIGQLIVFVEPEGRYWGWSGLADALSYNTLDRAQAETSPDRIVGLCASNNDVLIFGERTIEPWAFAPDGNATFQLRTGSVIESGCASGDTIKRLDNSVFYLTDNGQIARLDGYNPRIISTTAIEADIKDKKWSRAFAFTWEDKGHTVYYITFPDGHTWGYDVRQDAWHRRESFGLDRWRINALVKSNGKWIAGDFQDGRLYEVTWDSVYEGCEIMPRTLKTGVLHNNGNRVTVHGISILAAAGMPYVSPATPPTYDPEKSDILITGAGSGGTPTPFITAKAAAEPVFVGIATSTGANLDQAPCSVNSEGEFIAVAEDEILYSTDIRNTWERVSTSYPAGRGRFGVFGPDGWLLQYVAESHAGAIASASSPPIDADALTITISGVGTRSTLSWINYTGGYYWGTVGFDSTSPLIKCATIDGTWTVVCSEASSITTGSDSVRFPYDIVEFGGALYMCCYTASTFGGLGGGDCLRKSTDDGATWDTLLVDGRSSATIDPFQLCSGNGVLIAVNRDCTKVWTSEDGFSVAHSTGVSRSTADLPRNEVKGRFVAYADGLFFIMGDTSLCSTADGITFNDPVTYPSSFSGPLAIAAYNLTHDLTYVPDDCTAMEGGFFQLRYSNDGAENWSRWRDFEVPKTGNFLQPMIARRLGMTRHRVWEFMDTSNRPQDVLAASIIIE